jgi:hypothetical protein
MKVSLILVVVALTATLTGCPKAPPQPGAAEADKSSTSSAPVLKTGRLQIDSVAGSDSGYRPDYYVALRAQVQPSDTENDNDGTPKFANQLPASFHDETNAVALSFPRNFVFQEMGYNLD